MSERIIELKQKHNRDGFIRLSGSPLMIKLFILELIDLGWVTPDAIKGVSKPEGEELSSLMNNIEDEGGVVLLVPRVKLITTSSIPFRDLPSDLFYIAKSTDDFDALKEFIKDKSLYL